MKVNKGKSERKLLNQLKKGKRWCKVVGALACLVVFCTVYALILPAVTMDKTTDDRQEETSQEASGAVSEEGIMTLQAEGEDYRVTVTCDEGAGIPEGAVLEVTEYAEDSDEYKACFEKANSALIYTDGSCVHKARFF